MKIPKKLYAIALLLSATCGFAPAQEVPQNVGFLVEYYELEHLRLPALLRQYQQEPDGAGLLKTVRDMVKNGEAKLVESCFASTKNGQRSKIESIREHIYPTEYDPPEIPQTLTGPIDPDSTIRTPANPTAFDARYIGQTFEFEPNVDAAGGIVSVNIAPGLVVFQGDTVWLQGIGAAQQPLFDAAQTQTQLVLKIGSSELFGVSKPPGAESTRRVLGFISSIRSDQEIPKAKKADKKVEGAPQPNAMISLITEYIEVDVSVANELVRNLNRSYDGNAIRAGLDQLLADGKAQLYDTTTILTKTGQRAKAKSVREYIYPTEFDPAEIPTTLTGPIDPEVDLVTPSGLTAFDVRDLGVTVEVEPRATTDDDGNRQIDLNISTNSVQLVGELTYSSGKATSRQPLFETMNIATNAIVADGASYLLGMHGFETARAGKSASKEEQEAVQNRRVLVFVTAKVKPAN